MKRRMKMECIKDISNDLYWARMDVQISIDEIERQNIKVPAITMLLDRLYNALWHINNACKDVDGVGTIIHNIIGGE
jgi:hypothetical protein